MQLVLMSIPPLQTIPAERHFGISQFIRAEKGKGKAILNESQEFEMNADSTIIIPAGTIHEIKNTSNALTLKLYSIYAFRNSQPPHAKGLVEEKKIK